MRDNRALNLLATLFLISACVNMLIGYVWVSSWLNSQVRASAPDRTAVAHNGVAPNGMAQSAAKVTTTASSQGTDSPKPPSEEAQPSAPSLFDSGRMVLLPAVSFFMPEPTPTATLPPPPTSTPEPTLPASFPGPETVNGVPVDEIVVLTDATKKHIREIYNSGQSMGLRAEAFSKLGDSTIEVPLFLSRFDEGTYQLGEYAYLSDVIQHFSGSFSRDSLAVRIGQHSWTATDPMWADKSYCAAGESPVACEIRVHRPSILIIRLGANDLVGADYFRRHMEPIIAYAIEQGVIPVLSTRPIPYTGDENNQVMRDLAEDYDVPLWDFERAALTIPGAGLDGDAVHLTSFYSHDYTQPEGLTRGHGLQNLTALMVLDRVWRCLQ